MDPNFTTEPQSATGSQAENWKWAEQAIQQQLYDPRKQLTLTVRVELSPATE